MSKVKVVALRNLFLLKNQLKSCSRGKGRIRKHKTLGASVMYIMVFFLNLTVQTGRSLSDQGRLFNCTMFSLGATIYCI